MKKTDLVSLFPMLLGILLVSISTLPVFGQFTTVINIPPDPDLGNGQSIGSDTQLNLGAGGSIGSTFAAGATDGSSTNVEVNISGGTVGNSFRSFGGSTVNISGGALGNSFRAFSGSTVRVSGGTLGDSLVISAGSDFEVSGGTVGDDPVLFVNAVLDMTGGSIGNNLETRNNSAVNISGGHIGTGAGGPRTNWDVSGGFVDTDLLLNLNSSLDLSGGSVGHGLTLSSNSEVNLLGDDFFLDGVPINIPGSTLPFNLPAGAILSGTLSDGVSFTLSTDHNDVLPDGTITLVPTPIVVTGPPLITLPADPVPGGVGAGQTLEVTSGTDLRNDFDAGPGSTVNTTNSNVGAWFQSVGSNVNVSGGSVGDDFLAIRSSSVDIANSAVGERFRSLEQSDITITNSPIGDNFTAAGGSTVNLSGTTGGRAFRLTENSVLNIDGNGQVATQGSFSDAFLASGGSEVNLNSGNIGNNAEITGSGTTLNINGGSIGSSFDATDGSIVNLTTGSIGGVRGTDSTINIDGGTAGGVSGNLLNLTDGSIELADVETLNMSGGTIGPESQIRTEANLSGGSIGRQLEVDSGAELNIFGGEFMLDGVTIAGLDNPGDSAGVTLTSPFQLTGILEDGTPFAFHDLDRDLITDANITLFRTALPAIGPASISLPTDPVPDGLRDGQTLTIEAGGSTGEIFNAGPGSTVILDGGEIGEDFEAVGADVQILDGIVQDHFDALAGSTVLISGGDIREFSALNGSIVEVTGGLIRTNSDFNVSAGAMVTIAGGVWPDTIFNDDVSFSAGSDVHIFGRGGFRINGDPIPGLENPGDSILVDASTVDFLQAILRDGNPFIVNDVQSGAMIRLTRVVPEPGSIVLLLTASLAIVSRRR